MRGRRIETSFLTNGMLHSSNVLIHPMGSFILYSSHFLCSSPVLFPRDPSLTSSATQIHVKLPCMSNIGHRVTSIGRTALIRINTTATHSRADSLTLSLNHSDKA